MIVSCFSTTQSRENLLKFPHLAAIQHNNCMYLAHHLLTLGHHFRAHLPQPLSEGVATFVDMVPGFRKLGKQSSTRAVKYIAMKNNTEIYGCWQMILGDFVTFLPTRWSISRHLQNISCINFLWKFIHTSTCFPLGAQCFLAQLNVQRAELLERLSTAHNFCNLDDEDNYIAASKAVRQVRKKVH